MSLGISYFKVVYGHESPRLLSYEIGTSKVNVVNQALFDCDKAL